MKNFFPTLRIIALVVIIDAAQGSYCYATDLTIPVFSDGKPAAGVTVCAGSKQQRGLYGTTITDEKGKAFFRGLPDGRILFTAGVDGRNQETLVFGVNNPFSAGPMLALPKDQSELPSCPQRETDNSKDILVTH